MGETVFDILREQITMAVRSLPLMIHGKVSLDRIDGFLKNVSG